MIYRIFKYQLPQGPGAKYQIQLPTGSFALHIGIQDNQPIIWMSVNQDTKCKVIFEFTCVPTGGTWNHILDEYIATVQMPDGLVWHYVCRVFHCDANNP